MKKSFSGRRVPRKVGQDEDEDAPEISAVKRPSSKPRKSSHLRNSFGLSATDDNDTDHSSVVTPKRSQLSKLAVQRSASKRSSNLASQLPLRNLDDDEDRPNYNAASIRELKDSTPSTPRENSEPSGNTQLIGNPATVKALDLVSKFGTSLSRYEQPSAIPSAAEIAEKKARRARLAMEEKADEYVSLNLSDPELDNDDENTTTNAYGRLVLKPKDAYGEMESRLVRDDEDIMENFDDFTEDGRISLGQKAEAEAAKRRKEEMAAQIAAAEGASDSDSNTSDRERNAAFEAAQTKHGTNGQNATSSADSHANDRPKTPPIMTPLPTLDGVLERLRARQSELQASRMQKLQAMEALQREKVRLGEEEVRIQNALKETAQKFEALRKEKGITKETNTATDVVPLSDTNGSGANEAPSVEAEGHDTGKEEAGDEHPEMNYGGMRRGLGMAGLGMPAGEASDSDDY